MTISSPMLEHRLLSLILSFMLLALDLQLESPVQYLTADRDPSAGLLALALLLNPRVCHVLLNVFITR